MRPIVFYQLLLKVMNENVYYIETAVNSSGPCTVTLVLCTTF